MLPSNEDKKMLIESMKKLTHHISNNQIRQKQIFDSLARLDLLKIISNLSDDNQYLRRISGLFLAQLFYKNDDIKQKACKLLQIYPSQGRICLNQIPSQIQKYPSTFKKCIQLMKSPVKQFQDDKFCWTINLDRKVLQIQFFDYKKYSSFTFLDPHRNIFGFTLINKNGKQSLKKQNNYEINNSKQKSVKSIDSKGSSSKKDSFGINSSFYKNYLQFRNRKTESPNSYKDYYQKRDFNKPNTSRNNRNDYMPYKNNSTIQPTSPYSKNSREPLSYEKISTPVKKQSYDYKAHLNSSHQSLQIGSSGLRSPIGSAHRQISSGYRQPQTDRKHDTAYRYKIGDSQIFSSSNQKLKYPQTTKNLSLSNNNNNNAQQDKFYKRVKQILKR